jgi:hypothetical protein
VFWVISVYFNIRNTLPKSGTFLLGHPVYYYWSCMMNGKGADGSNCRLFYPSISTFAVGIAAKPDSPVSGLSLSYDSHTETPSMQHEWYQLITSLAKEGRNERTNE